MKRKYVMIGVLVLVAILLGTFFLVRANSQDIALSSAGVDTSKDLYAVEELTLTQDGKVFRVLQGTLKDGKLALIELTRSKLGFWQVKHIDAQETEEAIVGIGWMKKAARARFDATIKPEFHIELHQVYCGSNAVKQIDVNALTLPQNVTLEVYQVGELYVAHLTAICDGDFHFSILDAMRDAGFIQ